MTIKPYQDKRVTSTQRERKNQSEKLLNIDYNFKKIQYTSRIHSNNYKKKQLTLKNMFKMASAHPLNDGSHTYIRLKDLEIGKKYRICGFDMFRGNVAEIERVCPTVKIGDEYLILCERYLEIVDKLKLENTEPLYIAYWGPGKRSRPEFHFHDYLWNLLF